MPFGVRQAIPSLHRRKLTGMGLSLGARKTEDGGKINSYVARNCMHMVSVFTGIGEEAHHQAFSCFG